MISIILIGLGLGLGTSSQVHEQSKPTLEETAVQRLCREALALEPLAASQLGRRFLKGTSELPSIAPRTLYHVPR
jgi:hypothetical protein